MVWASVMVRLTMLRSASPSHAAPKTGAAAAAGVAVPEGVRPINATSSAAYTRFGSGWLLENVSLGTQFLRVGIGVGMRESGVWRDLGLGLV